MAYTNPSSGWFDVLLHLGVKSCRIMTVVWVSAIMLMVGVVPISAQRIQVIQRTEDIVAFIETLSGDNSGAVMATSVDPELLQLEESRALSLGHLAEKDLLPNWVFTVMHNLSLDGIDAADYTIDRLTTVIADADALVDQAGPHLSDLSYVESAVSGEGFSLFSLELRQDAGDLVETFSDFTHIIADLRQLLGFLEGRSYLNWLPAGPGTRLQMGETLRTGPNTSIRLRGVTGWVAEIAPNSTFTLRQTPAELGGLQRVRGVLWQGIMDFYYPPGSEAERKFEVETRMALTSIRGTEFTVRHQQGTTSLWVRSGTVSVQDLESGQTIVLTAGETAELGLTSKGPEAEAEASRSSLLEPAPGTGLERSDTAPYDQTGHIAEFPEGGQYLPPPAHPHALAWTENGYYRPGDEITVFFRGLPGNEYDWISLASVDYNDQTYLRWSYTQGNRSGFKSFAGLEAGKYEVRVYYDWSSGGYTVHSRYPFTIAEQIPEKVTVKRTPVETEPPSSTTLAWTRQSCYAPGAPITVDFRGLSGNRHDWVSIAEVGSLERSYLHWSYTNGIREGSLSFPCLEPGEYEVRVYFKWPEGGYEIQSRHPFSVSETAVKEWDPTQPPSTEILAWTAQDRYHANEIINVRFSGLPGNATDWISLAATGSADTNYLR